MLPLETLALRGHTLYLYCMTVLLLIMCVHECEAAMYSLVYTMPFHRLLRVPVQLWWL